MIERIRGRSLSVVLPEGTDGRILAAARRLKDERLAEPIVLGKPDHVQAAAAGAGVDLAGVAIHDPARHAGLDDYAKIYADRRGVDIKVAGKVVRRPLYLAGIMVAEGDAHTMVVGVACPTATVISAGVLTVGLAERVETPSSFFLMLLPASEGRAARALVYADCGVNIAPTAEELADIAVASERSARELLNEPPRVAMLSFSTKGSASHEHVTRVTDALAIARRKAPEAAIDGEFQVDAALAAAIAAKKVKDPSDVAGQANVLVFPDLNSGNIAYKLTEQLVGAKALGPILQGFRKPISDLSRGATVDDIVDTAAICLAQAVK